MSFSLIVQANKSEQVACFKACIIELFNWNKNKLF